jgi:hypothetical protein
MTDLWTELTERGQAAVQELCTTKAEEGQRLEFKRKTSPEREGLTDDDKRGLGETLSAMSNAEGGILLFGMASEKGRGGNDSAKMPQPIANVAALAGKIKTLVSEFLSPPNPDVEILPVCCNTDGSGLVAIRIGQSDFRPHMSMAPSHQKYFLRTQSSNRPMVDFQIRDMLRINTAPRLALGYQLVPGMLIGDIHQASLVLTLINNGRMSANQPYLIVHPGTTLHPTGPASEIFRPFPLSDRHSKGFQGSDRFAIHPGYEVPAVAFRAHIRIVNNVVHFGLDPNTNDYYVRFDRLQPIDIEVSIGAEHTAALDVSFKIDNAEMEVMAERVARARQPFHSSRRF